MSQSRLCDLTLLSVEREDTEKCEEKFSRLDIAKMKKTKCDRNVTEAGRTKNEERKEAARMKKLERYKQSIA